MKIPETYANIGAYNGNDENGQWQPNGVIIDNGVGGGVVGSGDAGVHRPPVYPVHIPRGHIPGYVMAGAYYPPPAYPPVPPAPQDDFADYMWMENEEEFDKQVMQQLEEEALMEQCIEAMLDDEQRERNRHVSNGHRHNHHYPTTSNGQPNLSLEETVSRSTLNPLAAEFVPTRARPSAPEEKLSTEVVATEETSSAKEKEKEPAPQNETVEDKDVPSQNKTEMPSPIPSETPEVSAADVQPITEKLMEKRLKDPKKETKPKMESKKPVKPDVKPKVKPQVIKSETKIPPKKKEVKMVKSEMKVEEKVEEVTIVAEVLKQIPPQSTEEVAPSGMKPINYAAAAKANKSKPKPTTPPVTDKPLPPPTKTEKPKPVEKVEKKEKVVAKDKIKTEKPNLQRKNSAK